MFHFKDNTDIPDGTMANGLEDCPRKECEICYEAMGSDYFAMFECTHTFCNDCAVTYFTIQVSFNVFCWISTGGYDTEHGYRSLNDPFWTVFVRCAIYRICIRMATNMRNIFHC